MRLRILNEGHGIGSKLLFALIRAVSRHPVLDVIKLTRYRPDFYGKPMGAVTQLAMRGPSAWSVGDRELMAAVVAKSNQCQWCTKAHTETAQGAYRDSARVAAALSELDSPDIAAPLRATLQMLRKLCTEHSVSAEEMKAVLDAGVTRAQIEDALAVAFAFNIVGRLADAFDFAMASDAAFSAGARYLLARGYR